MSTALSPDGRYLLVLNGGYKPPTMSVLDTATGRETGRVPVADGWLGLTFSPKGDRVYVGGGSRAAVFEFSFSNGALEATRTFTRRPESSDAIATSSAMSRSLRTAACSTPRTCITIRWW